MSAQLRIDEPVDAIAAESGRGMSREWRAFWANPLAKAGVAILVFLVLFSWVGPMFYRTMPEVPDLNHIVSPPIPGHPLGTDGVGADVLSQLMWGGQLSLLVGFAAAVVGSVIGAVYGLVAAEFGGWLDTILMRFVDITLAIPAIYILIVLDSILSPNAFAMVFVLAVTSWQGIARIVRGQVLSLRSQDFVEAARAVGSGRGRILFRHYLPNVMGQIIVYTTFGVGGAIIAVAALSFLGLGLPPTDPNWGLSLSNGVAYMFQNAWWLIYPPGILIVLAELSINFLGDSFSTAFDPRLRGRK
jgi:peptide/nickel transport system permease protein